MKPIYIRMKAFGSYRDERIDFDDVDHGIFLITGDTGAGKTTIFDAITYALFDSSSGGKRDEQMMISQYAKPMERTEVEYCFKIGEDRYKIVRIPGQKKYRERNPYILSVFDEDISSLIQNYIMENCNGLVKIITDDVVSEFVGENEVKGILTAKGQGFDTEMVVISAGVKPVVDIAQDAGIALGITGAIKVNSRMETSVPDIYACGDCTEKINIITNTPVWIPLGSTANKEGRVAAVNLCGGSEDFEGVLGSAVTRYLDLNISMSGLSEKNAQKLGYDTVSVIVTKKDKAGYMPEVENITLKLVADRRSHRVLGAQAIGCGDADKKVNTISVGLARRLTVEDLLDVDLTYAPPFSTSVDILHSAARMLKSKLS